MRHQKWDAVHVPTINPPAPEEQARWLLLHGRRLTELNQNFGGCAAATPIKIEKVTALRMGRSTKIYYKNYENTCTVLAGLSRQPTSTARRLRQKQGGLRIGHAPAVVRP